MAIILATFCNFDYGITPWLCKWDDLFTAYALFVDPVYNNLQNYTGAALVVATVAFAVQIYCDFSGYSDIARGCAETMGIDLTVNFKAPYLATSMTEFWRRWHISLTDWFREYVYIPLGGNRKGKAIKLLFVLITFALSGLWHGATWNFVIWGLVHAVLLDIESAFNMTKPRIIAGQAAAICFNAFRWVIAFSLECLSWAVFRSKSLSDAEYVLRYSVTGLRDPLAWCKAAYWALNPGKIMLAVIGFSGLLMLAFDLANEKQDVIQKVSLMPAYIRWPAYVAFLCMLILFIPKEVASPFLYFQF